MFSQVIILASSLVFAWWWNGESESKTNTVIKVTSVIDAEKLAKEAAQKAADTAAIAAANAASEKVAAVLADAKAKYEEEKARRAEEREDEKTKRAYAKEDREIAKALKDEQDAKRKEELRQIDTKVFRLNHASAEEVAQKFNEMWNGEFGQTWKVSKMAVAFQESNSIMITAPLLILNACEKMIMELDVAAPQVYIEARFVELSNNASHKLGIDWQMLDGMQGSMKLGGGFQGTKLGEGVENYTPAIGNNQPSYSLSGTKSSDADISYFNGTLDFSEMYLIMRALESSEDAKVFSNPKIIVSSGKKAKVDMTEKYPNVTVSAKRTTSGDSNSLDLSMNMAAIPGEDKFMFAKEAFFSWGIELEVTPRINTNGLINVSIVPTISSRTDWVTAGASDTINDKENSAGTYSSKYPVINVQRLITEFNMASETTAVIGGLSRTIETQRDNGIPWLRNIWWIGPKLFGSKVRVKEQKEILVFVTVGLVDPHNVRKDAGLPKNAVLGRQFVKGRQLEPGDREGVNQGLESLDLRPLSIQAKDPLNTNVVESVSSDDGFTFAPFKKDPEYKKGN
jgi:type II secretory pathway component GspD/PulD (secretin)